MWQTSFQARWQGRFRNSLRPFEDGQYVEGIANTFVQHHMNKIIPLLISLMLFTSPLRAANPDWIWHDNKGAAIKTNEVRFFRKVFRVETRPQKALLSIAADDDAIVYINGKEVVHAKNYDQPSHEEVTREIRKGDNVIAIRGLNTVADQAGVVAILELRLDKKGTEFVVTDPTWVSSQKEADDWQKLEFSDAKWTKAVSRGKHGDKPWGEVLKVPKATAAESLTVLPGFKVQLLHSSEIGEGSWICLTADAKGR